jgi:membrane protein implicated in regulation of membrane protease activity
MRWKLFAYYLAWQAPSWIVVTLALLLLAWLAGLPAWLVPVGVAAFVLKDVAMYRVLRHTLQPPRARLVGARGRAVEPLAPRGYVRVEGELWQAEAINGHIALGAEVVVREAQGLTLRVEPAAG